jgi:predicted secreted protein
MSEKSDVRVVQVGQQFAIDLEAMPGAGYMWEMTRPSEEMELISQNVVSISKEIGGNSTQRFLLVAHLPGSYSLVFQLKRKWEENPVRTSLISIHAE